MAKSYQTATSDGSLVLLNISIDYFTRDEITVLLDGIVTVAGWSWVGVDDKQISFSPAVATGVEVRVQRLSDVQDLRHTFSAGAKFNAPTLDEQMQQLLRVAQESQEGVTPTTDLFRDLNMHGFTLKDLADPVDPQDPVTLASFGTTVADIAASEVAAAASAAASAASAVAADLSADAAALSETNAAASEVAAAASAVASAASAVEAAGFVVPSQTGHSGALITNGAAVSWLDSAFSHRNKIIGGDFTTNPWQRGTSFTALASGSYGPDRWAVVNTSAAVVDVSKVIDAPTAAQVGSYTAHCFDADITTADAIVAATDTYQIVHRVEGLTSASFGFGQAGTRYVTLSFWIKATKTGISTVSFSNSAFTRTYVAEFTILASNTWEKKELVIPVDTSGTWLYNTGVGLRVSFNLMCGTTYHTTPGAWQAGNFVASAGQVNHLDSVSNIYRIALVQLEAGSVATPFEHRPIGTELALCQSYTRWQAFNIHFAATSPGEALEAPVSWPTMRATPTAATISADPNTTQTAINNATNSVLRLTPYGGSVAITATAAGVCSVLGYRVLLTAEL